MVVLRVQSFEFFRALLGGLVLLPVVVGHGISNAEAIKNMVLLCRDMVQTALTEKIKLAFQ